MENISLNSINENIENPQNSEFTYLNCLFTNADSLTNKIPDFKLRVMENNPDIVAVAETWLQSEQSSEYYCTDESIELDRYQLIRKDNPDTKKGGIILYVKTTWKLTLKYQRSSRTLLLHLKTLCG